MGLSAPSCRNWAISTNTISTTLKRPTPVTTRVFTGTKFSIAPKAKVIHRVAGSCRNPGRLQRYFREGERYFLKKWGGFPGGPAGIRVITGLWLQGAQAGGEAEVEPWKRAKKPVSLLSITTPALIWKSVSSPSWPIPSLLMRILIIDNHSKDDSALFLEKIKDPRIRVYINNSNVGYSKACNQGLVEATGDYFVTMNPDVVVPEGWLTHLLYHLEVNPRTLIVGPKAWGSAVPSGQGRLVFLTAACSRPEVCPPLPPHVGTGKIPQWLPLLLFDRRLLRCIGFLTKSHPGRG